MADGFSRMGIPLTETALCGFRAFYELLMEKNAVMNLTAITGEEDVARLHFLDCVALLTVCDFSGKRVIDVGTGAGFPGVPLGIAAPEARVTLLDSQLKRVRFLEETVTKLGLSMDCICARAEEAGELRESFDIAVSRAVSRMDVLCELCLPFVRPGGRFLAMKGPDCRDEISQATRAIELLGGDTPEIIPYTIPGTDVRHAVVVINKVKPTPEQYPRRFAKIQKNPL